MAMTTRESGRHNKTKAFCEICKKPVRSLPRHMRRQHPFEARLKYGPPK